MRAPLAALLVPLLLLLAPPARAATEVIASPRVRVVAEQTSEAPRQGYLTLRLRAENLTLAPQRVEARFESRPWAEVRLELSLAPGERRTVPLLVPAAGRFGTLTVDDGRDQGREGFSWHWQNNDAVLVEGPTAAAPLLAKNPGGGLPSGGNPVDAVAREELPATLAALAGYAAVGVLETPFEELSEPQRRALEAYAATGGRLFLPRIPERPELFLPAWQGAVPAGTHRYGFGEVVVCAGVEPCLAQLAAAGPIRRLATPSAPSAVHHARARRPAPADLTERDPLLEVARVPVGGFLLLVLGFVLVLGPGSFLVRARRGPHALLAFIPLTALATCGGIAGYGVFHEGLFTIHASSRTATLLDAVGHRAVTLSVDAYYASLAPSAVRLGALEAIVFHEDGVPPGLRIDQTDGFVFQGGLIPSRSYREHLALAVTPSRARLSARASATGEAPVVENALGAAITEGLLHLGGRHWRLQGVPAGGSARAVAAEGEAVDEALAALRLPLAGRFAEAGLDQTLLAPLGEGEFAVALERAVFAAEGGLSPTREEDGQLVRGRLSP